MHTERFAPSPTGPLHLGHAYSAWLGWSRAHAAGGRFLLRMEDLDADRTRPEWYKLIEEDLRWLGFDWSGPVLCQSARLSAYDAALARLQDMGLVYACTCTRRDIRDAIAAPQEGAGPNYGLDGLIYPGTCREAGHAIGPGVALRLHMAGAVRRAFANTRVDFQEDGQGPGGESGRQTLDPASLVQEVGDVVLRRRDGAHAYHLAVVVDDAHQDVTHVTRGEDLFPATQIHRLLQALLDLPTPVYHHHRLVRDDQGKRLAKRDDARAISKYREDGLSPAEVLRLAGVTDPVC